MKWCGFGVVTIHAGHGWLLNQFMDPKENNRKDRVGRQPREPLSLSVCILRLKARL
jgi:2,4-dienoyl-CoA reductase-like NADH-dependent reductase (Old Yellow Enzyme family)